VVAIVAAGLAWFVRWRDAKRRENATAQYLLNHGCGVVWLNGREMRKRSPWLQWFGLVLSEDCLGTLYEVDFPAKVEDADLAALDSVRNVTKLHFARSQRLTPAGLRHLANLPKLNYLSLKESPVGDAGLLPLRHNHSFEELWLDSCSLTSASMPWIASNRGLTHLDLDGAKLTDESLAPLAGLEHLEVLALTGVPITSKAIPPLCQLPKLTHLYLMKTQVDDEGLLQLATVPTLRSIDIRYTPTTPEGRAAFKQKLPNCRLED
jgi:Leucine-rich repeat (LRR) protein